MLEYGFAMKGYDVNATTRKTYCRLLCLLLLFLVLLSACGKEERQLGIDGYVYVAEELRAIGSIDNFKEKDGYLYYVQDDTLYRFSAEQLENREEGRLPWGKTVLTASGGSLRDYTCDSEGGIWYVLVKSDWKDGIQGGALIRQDPEGKETCRLEFEKIDTFDVSLAADGKNHIFLLAGDFIYVADTEGNLIASVPSGKFGAEFYEGNGRLLQGEDGSVYYTPSDNMNVVYEIAGEETLLLQRIKLPCGSGKCYSATQGLLCCDGSDGMLYRYRKADSKWDPVLRYGDSNLQTQPAGMIWLSEERLAAFYQNYPDSRFCLLDKVEVASLPEKEVLVLATGNLSRELEDYITEFNKTGGEYHIRVESLWDEELDIRMASSDPPDLIDMDDETVLKYAGKRALEDLNFWLEKSALLDREDFLENVLEGYTIDGRLVCIPDRFECETAVGRVSQLGQEAGWTAERAIAFAEAHPEAKLFRNPTFTSLISFFRKDILERYIDWEKGECSFDGEKFCAFVRWAEAYSEGFGNGMAGSLYDSFVGTRSQITGEELLLAEAAIFDLTSLVRHEMWMEEAVSAIGYPTADGSVFHSVHAEDALGISADSENKEAAWQFLEGFLAKEEDREGQFCNDLFTRRDALEEKLEELVTPEYDRDENGEVIVYDSTGEPGLRRRTTFYMAGEEFPFYYLTQEQADEILELIEAIDFTPEGGVETQILGILLEELGPYLEGQKSLEEAAHILQNRVQNLVRENM